MRVLLINPPAVHKVNSETPDCVKQHEGIYPPLGLLYVASFLKSTRNDSVKVLDMHAENMSCKGLETYISQFNPEIVGITVYTHTLIDVLSVVSRIKKLHPACHICLGGPHIGIFPEESIALPGVDSVIAGEGERSFVALVSALERKEGLNTIGGILYKDKGAIIRGNPAVIINDLDSLPFPDRESVCLKKYYTVIGKKSTSTTVLSTRGCPYHCSFCRMSHGTYRVRSINNIIQEIEQCVRMGIQEFNFIDDTFNLDDRRVSEFCQALLQRSLRIRWSFRGRINSINQHVLRFLKNAGCFRIHLGIETSSDEGLRRLNKELTIVEIRQVFQWIRKSGIQTVAYFMLGCPHERTREDILRTIAFAQELNPDFALFNLFTPYPGTALYQEALARSLFKKDFWHEFSCCPFEGFQPPVWEEFLSKKELEELVFLAFKKFYLRPRLALRMLFARQDMGMLLRKARAGLEIMFPRSN